MNKKEAVKLFVERDFNNIPLSLVEKAYQECGLSEKILQPVQPEPSDFELDDDSEPEFYEEEPIREDFDSIGEYQEAVEDYEKQKEEHDEKYRRWQEYQTAYEEWEQKCEDYYPMWGTIFECGDSFISQSIIDNLKEVQDIGFIVLDDFDELNICLGVAGAGYSFYEAHWTPLYDLLGLHWHNKEDSEE
jgi:hypothetical protein